MLKVKKRSGKLETFKTQKIVRSCRKSGANKRNAQKIAKKVEADVSVISYKKLRKLVLKYLKRTDRKAYKHFVAYLKKKYRKKKR